MLVAVSLAGLVFDRAAVEGRIVAEMRDLIGHEGAEVAETLLRHAGNRDMGALSVGIGLVVLLVGATTVFVELQDALNRIWKAEAGSGRGALSSFVKERLDESGMQLHPAPHDERARHVVLQESPRQRRGPTRAARAETAAGRATLTAPSASERRRYPVSPRSASLVAGTIT